MCYKMAGVTVLSEETTRKLFPLSSLGANGLLPSGHFWSCVVVELV